MFRNLLLMAMIATAAAIAVGLAGSVHPLFDTISNFRLHLSVALVAMALVRSLRCSRVPALAFGLGGLAGVVLSSAGLPMDDYSLRAHAGEKVYTVYAKNLLWHNATPLAVVDQIVEHDPDMLFLTEVSANWREALAKLGSRYPYSFRCAEWQTIGGSVILSRIPLDNSGAFCGAYASLGLTHAVIEGRRVSLGIVHLRWPWPASGPRQISELTPVLEGMTGDALIAGDYNTATWTHSARRFAEAGKLTRITGIGPTFGPKLTVGGTTLQWPPRLGLPIDNASVKGAVHVVERQRLPLAGSDHLGVLIRFVMR